MKDSDSEVFSQSIGALYALYEKPLSPPVARLWWEALKKYDLAAVTAALSRLVSAPDRNGSFIPKPADVARVIEGSTEDQALIAWAKVDKAVRQVGPWQTVVFDDPLIMRVLSDMGGWTFLGDKTDDDWPFVAKEFENRYRGYSGRGSTPDYPKRLIGFFEAGNSATGQEIASPILIGNPNRALKVLQGGVETLALTTTPLNLLSLPGPGSNSRNPS